MSNNNKIFFCCSVLMNKRKHEQQNDSTLCSLNLPTNTKKLKTDREEIKNNDNDNYSITPKIDEDPTIIDDVMDILHFYIENSTQQNTRGAIPSLIFEYVGEQGFIVCPWESNYDMVMEKRDILNSKTFIQSLKPSPDHSLKFVS